MVNFTTVTCRIYSQLKWYKNYKNRLRLAKVIVKNKMSRFLWFTVYKTGRRYVLTRCSQHLISNITVQRTDIMLIKLPKNLSEGHGWICRISFAIYIKTKVFNTREKWEGWLPAKNIVCVFRDWSGHQNVYDNDNNYLSYSANHDNCQKIRECHQYKRYDQKQVPNIDTMTRLFKLFNHIINACWKEERRMIDCHNGHSEMMSSSFY